MSRRFVGDWAEEAPLDLRPAAIVALGVLVAELWPGTGLGQPEEVAGGGAARISQVFRSRLEAALDPRRYSPKRLRWGHYDPKRWRNFKRLFSPEAAAQGWISFVKEAHDLKLQSWTFHLNDENVAETYPWLNGLVREASGIGVTSIFFEWWNSSWPADARRAWHWPLRLGFLDDSASRTLFEEYHRADNPWLRNLTSPVEVERNGLSCDLLLSPVSAPQTRDALLLSKARATAITLLGGRPFNSADGVSVTADLQAASMASAIAYVPGDDLLEIVTDLIRQISHDEAFDSALHHAMRWLGKASPLVIANEQFIEYSRISQLGERWATTLELRGASVDASKMHSLASAKYLSEEGAANDLLRFSRTSNARQPRPRYLQAETRLIDGPAGSAANPSEFKFVHERELRRTNVFTAERWHLVSATIAPIRDVAASALPAFPDSQIDWDGGPQRLTIVVTAPDSDVIAVQVPLDVSPFGETLLRDLLYLPSFVTEKAPNETASTAIEIWPTGSSEVGAFLLRPRRAGELKARVMAVHGNRVLQTAILQGHVLQTEQDVERPIEGIRLVPEGIIRSSLQDLEDRRVFDLALLTNDSLTGTPQVTVVSDKGVWLRDLGEVKNVAERIGSRLHRLIKSPDEFQHLESEATVLLLKSLAREGVLIRRSFEDAGLGEILDADPSRIQIIGAKPDEALMLEFIYDGRAPDSEAAACPNQAEALVHASCGTCPYHTASTHVCAIRFWGMRKVIERHLYHPKTAPSHDTITAAPPSPDLERIRRPRVLLFASSQIAAKFPGGAGAIQELKQRLAALAEPPAVPIADGQEGVPVHAVGSWNEWRDCVQAHAPALLVLLPHTGVQDLDEVLQIGESDVLTNAQIDSAIVGAKQPVVVMLLGCETASAQIRYAGFVAGFRHAKASVVIGTLTYVLGRHAAPVAGALAEQLDRLWNDRINTVTIGDAVTEMRRRLMQKGLPIGLTIVAFGDADWLIGA